MAIGSITVGAQAGQRTSVPGPRAIPLQFAGDGTYPAGGTPDFTSLVRAALGYEGVTVVTVTGEDCGGYVVTYNRAADKLKVWEQDGSGPLVENATANLSGVTFNVIAWVK